MNRSLLQTQTATFLEGYKNTKHKNFRINNEQEEQDQGKERRTEPRYVAPKGDSFVSGAAPAILPMQISTISADPSKRVVFTLLINPEYWNHSKTNSYQTTYTRNGWAVQLWGANQDTISSTGKTAAMMTPGAGLDNFNRNISLGYLNLLSFISAYRSNGYEFEDFININSLTRVVKLVHGVRIFYDNESYMGHFNNFTVDEDDEHPYLFNYNFEFIISTLSARESEVRGHYKDVLEYSDLITGTEKDPEILMLAADSYTKSATAVISAPKPADRTTERLWARVTGLSFREAFSLKYTDGTVQRNIALRSLLLTKKWDPAGKRFN